MTCKTDNFHNYLNIYKKHSPLHSFTHMPSDPPGEDLHCSSYIICSIENLHVVMCNEHCTQHCNCTSWEKYMHWLYVCVYVCWVFIRCTLYLYLCVGKGCDEGCDGRPTADQQWEDSAELGSSEHAPVSSGLFLHFALLNLHCCFQVFYYRKCMNQMYDQNRHIFCRWVAYEL